LQTVAAAVLDSICSTLGLANIYLGTWPHISDVLAALARRALKLLPAAALDLNMRVDSIELEDILPSLPRQFAAGSSQPSLIVDETGILPGVDAAIGSACSLSGARLLGSGVWQGSCCLQATFNPLLHTIARMALSYAHEAPCAALLRACTSQRIHTSTATTDAGMHAKEVVAVFFLPCTSSSGMHMQSWYGYASSRSAPGSAVACAPKCTAVAAFVTAVPEMGLVSLVAMPHGTQGIPYVAHCVKLLRLYESTFRRDDVRSSVHCAHVQALQNGTAGGLFSVHDTPCVAPLPPLALPPALHTSMVARQAAASAKEVREGAALRHASSVERSGVIAGPAFSQLQHTDNSITKMYVISCKFSRFDVVLHQTNCSMQSDKRPGQRAAVLLRAQSV